MKKILLSALMLTAGIAAASAQSFSMDITSDFDKEGYNTYPKNYQPITEGGVYYAKWEWDDAQNNFESVVFIQTTNLTSSTLNLTMTLSGTDEENNISTISGADQAPYNCWAGLCVDGNVLHGELEPNAVSTGFANHLSQLIYAEKADEDKILFKHRQNVTVTDGNQTLNFTVVYQSPASTGIDTIGADTAEAQYFNLQGMRVANPEAGQLYIKRQAGKAVKVIY